MFIQGILFCSGRRTSQKGSKEMLEKYSDKEKLQTTVGKLVLGVIGLQGCWGSAVKYHSLWLSGTLLLGL